MAAPFQPRQVFERRDVDADEPAYLRILHMPPRSDLVATTLAPCRRALPVWMPLPELDALVEAGDLVFSRQDPLAAAARRNSELTEAEKAGRDTRWKLIESLVTDPDQKVLDKDRRGPLVNRAAIEGGSTKTTVYDTLRLYWQGGMFENALVPRFAACGAPGTVRWSKGPRVGPDLEGDEDPRAGVGVTQSIADLLAEGIPLLLRGHSYRDAWLDVVDRFFSDKVTRDGVPQLVPRPDSPTLRQFTYHVLKRLGRHRITEARKGTGNFDRNLRAKVGGYRVNVPGPGAIYQIDSTVLDIVLRSAHTPEHLLGRPVLYLVRDVYSGLYVGYLLTMCPPSKRTLRLALENALTDKVEYCAKLGMTIKQEEWPCRHRPSGVLTDNGSENLTELLIEIGKDLSMNPAQVQAMRPNLKGLIEHGIRFLSIDLVAKQPGAWRQRARGDKPCALDARHTMQSLRKLIAIWMIKANHNRNEKWPEGYVSPDGRDPSHLDLWEQGQRHFGAPQLLYPDQVREALLERGKGRTTKTGLLFHKRLYEPVDGRERHILHKLPGGRSLSLDVRYDARRIGEIQVYRNGSATTWRLVANEGDISEMSEEEWDEHGVWRRSGTRKAFLHDRNATSGYRLGMNALVSQVGVEMGGIKAIEPPEGRRKAIQQARLEESRDGAPSATVPALPALPAPARRPLVPDYTDEIKRLTQGE